MSQKAYPIFFLLLFFLLFYCSFYLILPTLPLSPQTVNIFWTACKGITHFHDTVISTYLKVQVYHISVVQSSLLSVLFISFFFLGPLHRVIASSHFNVFSNKIQTLPVNNTNKTYLKSAQEKSSTLIQYCISV